MNFHVFRDRLIVEAETPAEGYHLHGVLEEIVGFGFDCRNDIKGERAAIQIPLRKQGELSELDRASIEANAEKRA